MIFLLPYVLMFPAVIRLRKIDPGRTRPFQVPGGTAGLWTAVILATASVIASLVLFLWTPGAPVDWSYTGPLVAIAAAAIIAGEIIAARCMRKLRHAPPTAAAGPDEEPDAGPQQLRKAS